MSQHKDGGYCPMCDIVWASPGKCRCDENLLKSLARPGDLGAEMGMPAIEDKINFSYFLHDGKLLDKNSWNAAIEAAAEHMIKTCYNGKPYADVIRKLKK